MPGQALMPMLTAYQNLFSLFFLFDVCRFFTSKRCVGYFRLWSAMRVLVEVLVRDWEKKTSFGRKFWEAPWSAETKHVLVNPKRFTKTFDSWLLPQYCWVCLYSYSKPLFKSICSTQTPTLAQHCLIIQLKMRSIFPLPRRPPFLSPSVCGPRLPFPP